jgi:hypothetical protein
VTGRLAELLNTQRFNRRAAGGRITSDFGRWRAVREEGACAASSAEGGEEADSALAARPLCDQFRVGGL